MGQERNRWREGWLNKRAEKHPLRSDRIVSGETDGLREKKEKERRKKKEEEEGAIGEAAVFGDQRIISFGDKRTLWFDEWRGTNSEFIHFLRDLCVTSQVCGAELI